MLYLWRICMNFPGFVQPSYKQKRFNLSNKLQNNSNIYFLFLVKLLFFSFAKIQNSTFLNRMVAKKPPNFPYSPLIVLKNTIIFAHLKLQNLTATEMLSAEKKARLLFCLLYVKHFGFFLVAGRKNNTPDNTQSVLPCQTNKALSCFLPLFRHRRNTTILLLSITKPQKSRQRKRNNFVETCRKGQSL